MFGRKYSEGSAQFEDGRKITDKEVAKFLRHHMHWWDRLDYHKVSDSAFIAFGILSGSIEQPKKKKWFF